MQLCDSLNILWHCFSLGLEWKLIFSSPVATAEFSRFAGFRKGRGTRNQIANICWIIEKARKFQKNICFIDYTKAIDCVDHHKLWKILEETRIPDHLICLLRNLYAGQEATVRTGHGTTVQFSRSVVSDSLQPLSITNSQSLLKFMSIESVMPSHPLSFPSSPTFNLSQHQDLFKWVSSLHQVAEVLEFQLQHQSFYWIFRTDFL